MLLHNSLCWVESFLNLHYKLLPLKPTTLSLLYKSRIASTKILGNLLTPTTHTQYELISLYFPFFLPLCVSLTHGEYVSELIKLNFLKGFHTKCIAWQFTSHIAGSENLNCWERLKATEKNRALHRHLHLEVGHGACQKLHQYGLQLQSQERLDSCSQTY